MKLFLLFLNTVLISYSFAQQSSQVKLLRNCELRLNGNTELGVEKMDYSESPDLEYFVTNAQGDIYSYTLSYPIDYLEKNCFIERLFRESDRQQAQKSLMFALKFNGRVQGSNAVGITVVSDADGRLINSLNSNLSDVKAECRFEASPPKLLQKRKLQLAFSDLVVSQQKKIYQKMTALAGIARWTKETELWIESCQGNPSLNRSIARWLRHPVVKNKRESFLNKYNPPDAEPKITFSVQ